MDESDNHENDMVTEGLDLAEQDIEYVRIEENKKTKKRIVIVALVSLIIAIPSAIAIVSFVEKVHNIIYGPPISKYLDYLTEKYGDEGFYYTGRGASCVWIDSGKCHEYFSSEQLEGRSFKVMAYYENVSFADQYYYAKYNNEFNDYYYEKYGKFFEIAIPSSLQHSITINNGNQFYFNKKQKFASFEELINRIEEEYIDRLEVNINIDYKDIHTDEFTEINSEDTKTLIKSIVEENNLSEIPFVNLSISMEGSGETGLCPEELHASTYRYNSYGGYSLNINDSDNEITNCVVRLYNKFRK